MLIVNGKQVFTTLEEVADPGHCALLLIDLQNDYIVAGGWADKTGWDLSSARGIVPHVKHILDAARGAGMFVVHAQLTMFSGHVGESPAVLQSYVLRTRAGSGPIVERCIKGTRGWRIVDELAPLPHEMTVEKQHSSAFMATNLDLLLRSNGIRSVAVAGLVTHGCVMATADDAPAFGYYPVLVEDCIAGPSKELHDAALLIMRQKMLVASSAQVTQAWSRRASSPGA